MAKGGSGCIPPPHGHPRSLPSALDVGGKTPCGIFPLFLVEQFLLCCKAVEQASTARGNEIRLTATTRHVCFNPRALIYRISISFAVEMTKHCRTWAAARPVSAR